MWLYASNSSSQLTPISAPESISFPAVFLSMGRGFFRRFRKNSGSKKTLPTSPLKKAIRAESSGSILRKIPMVPKISMESVSISRDPGLFLSASCFIAFRRVVFCNSRSMKNGVSRRGSFFRFPARRQNGSIGMLFPCPRSIAS